MPRFEYSALTRDGRTITGHVDAESRPLAIAELADAGRFVTSLDEPATYDRDAVEREVAPRSRPGSLLPWRSRVSHRALASMLRQLAVALQSGLPLLNAVRVVEQQAEQAPLAELAADLADRVQGGESFSAALAAHPGHFSEMQIAMARVGETAGVLDQTMGHLADFAERELDVREKVRSAAAYPLFVLGLAAVSIVIIMTWILPGIIDTVLADADPQTLPWITRVMMAASNFAASFSGLMTALLIGFGAYLLRKWAVTPTGRLAVHRMLLRLPVIGPAWRKVAVARFARTLGILTRSGIQIIEAMRVIRDTLGNEALALEIDHVTARITEGQSIADPLRETGQFPPLLTQVIAMGERTGRLDALLLQTAESYEKETEAALARVMTILPALFIVVMALVVGVILAAVLLPIMTMDVGTIAG